MAQTKPVEDLRRRILDASLGLIAAEGLEAFSMREVARRAGVSHQAPYHHFPDREAIMAALVAEGFTMLRADTLAAGEDVGDPYARLSAIGKAYVEFGMRHPAHFKLMFRSEWVRAEKHEEAQTCAEGAFAVLAEAIAAIAGARNDANDQTMLLIAWSIAHGLATLILEGKLAKACGEGGEAGAVAQVFDQFEAMLRAPR